VCFCDKSSGILFFFAIVLIGGRTYIFLEKIGSINIFVGSENELQIANLLGQAKTISSGSSEKRLCVLWIS
jgi:hypothetical protein